MITSYDLKKNLNNIVAGPPDPDRKYISSGYTYGEIYAMAADLRHRHFSDVKPESVCLCTKDRAVTAASMLAALTRPITLILPYAFSADVLVRTQKTHGFSKAVSDGSSELPPGVEALFPDPGNRSGFEPVPAETRHPDSVFVKLFTGGSTQAPRTWSKTIRNLFGEAIYHARKLKVSPNDRFAATVPPYHIYGLLFSVLTPFVSSASVIEGELIYPHEIQEAVSRNRAGILVSIPLHYKMLSGMNFKTDALRFALSSAARLEPAVSKEFFQQTGLGITEIFGSTETGGIASRLCSYDQPHFTPFDCIDWKIAGHLLAIRSDFISPELPVDSEGFFTTSDQANVVGPNGFELAGRADQVVKVGGRRVDLEEVRSAIAGMPGVEDAAVICAEKSGTRGSEIRAVAAARIENSEIRHYLQNRLPNYAIPRRIQVVEHIPVSSAGKYDYTGIKKLLFQ